MERNYLFFFVFCSRFVLLFNPINTNNNARFRVIRVCKYYSYLIYGFISCFSSTLLDDSSNKEQQRSYTASHAKTQEPNIDFELDVKVFINSGKCVLHTKDQTREDELKL